MLKTDEKIIQKKTTKFEEFNLTKVLKRQIPEPIIIPRGY